MLIPVVLCSFLLRDILLLKIGPVAKLLPRLRTYAAVQVTVIVLASAATNTLDTNRILQSSSSPSIVLPIMAFYAFLAVEGLGDSLDLAKKLVTRHGVAVAPGVAFGSAGEGWLRVCFAQSATLMERAMQRLRDGLRAEIGS